MQGPRQPPGADTPRRPVPLLPGAGTAVCDSRLVCLFCSVPWRSTPTGRPLSSERLHHSLWALSTREQKHEVCKLSMTYATKGMDHSFGGECNSAGTYEIACELPFLTWPDAVSVPCSNTAASINWTSLTATKSALRSPLLCLCSTSQTSGHSLLKNGFGHASF